MRSSAQLHLPKALPGRAAHRGYIGAATDVWLYDIGRDALSRANRWDGQRQPGLVARRAGGLRLSRTSAGPR